MEKKPLVYIIILTWNGKNETIECLSSLEKISYSNFKVLVVDNASTDGTQELVEAKFPKVEYIYNDTNLRYAGGNNVGIEYALKNSAEYILLLNNDTIVDKNFLNELINTAEKTPEAGIIGPKIYYYSQPERIWYAGGKIDWWKGLIIHRGVREIDSGQYNTTTETDFVSGCCILVKQNVFERIGKLDTSYFMYGEDVDFCIRARRAGYKILFEPRAKIWHKISVSTGGHFSWFKNWNKLKSQLKIFAKYASIYHWISIPFGLLIYIITSLIRAKKV